MTFDGTNVASGLIAEIGAKEQAAWGTFLAAPVWLGIVNNFTMSRVSQIVPLGGIRDSRVSSAKMELGYHYEGVIEGQIQNAMPFYMALGGISTTATYDHAITIARAAVAGTLTYLPCFSIHAAFYNWDGSTADELIGLEGLTVNSATFRYPLNEPATFSLNYIAADIDTSSSTVPTESALAAYHSYNTDVIIDSDAATFSSGDDIVGLNAIEFTIDNNLTISHDFNTATIRRPYMGSLRNGLSARLDRKYIDTDLTALADGTPFSLRIESTRTASTDLIHLTLNGCYINKLERTMNIENAIENTPIDIDVSTAQVDAVDAVPSYE